jgi:hypothetical protein
MRTLTAIVVALVIAMAAASQAMAGMCEEPPYGASEKGYKLFVDTFGKAGSLDFLPNVCRAKYKGDEKIRKALVDIGISSYEIDHDDVILIAIKALKEFAKFQKIH